MAIAIDSGKARCSRVPPPGKALTVLQFGDLDLAEFEVVGGGLAVRSGGEMDLAGGRGAGLLRHGGHVIEGFGRRRHTAYSGGMILITVKFPIREDKLEEWRELSTFYAEAVTAEPGNEFFEFSESVLEPNTFVCIEGFRDADAGAEHMKQDHVARFMSEMPDIVAAQPQIIYVDAAEVEGFVPMGEIQPRES